MAHDNVLVVSAISMAAIQERGDKGCWDQWPPG